MNLKNYFHTGSKIYADNPSRGHLQIQAKTGDVTVAFGDAPTADSFFTIPAGKNSNEVGGAPKTGSISGRIHINGDCAIATDCELVEFVAPDLPNPVVTFTLSSDKATVSVGESGTISIGGVQPVDADNDTKVYVSPAKNIATVDYVSGEFVGKGEGVVNLEGWMDSVGKTVQITVLPALQSFDIAPLDASIAVAGTQQFTASNASPATAALTNLVWSSSDESIATFAGDTATGVAAGTVTVTATDIYSGATATTTLTVA